MSFSEALQHSKGDEFKEKLKAVKFDFDTQDDNGKL